MRELSEYIIEQIEDVHKINEKGSTTFEITTNGTLLNAPESISYLRDYGPRIELSISIDGNKSVHDSERVFKDGRGSYDIVSKNIRYLMNENVNLKRFNARVTLTPEHAKDYAESLISLVEMGFYEIIVSSDKLAVWDEESAKELVSSYVRLTDYLMEKKLIQDVIITDFDPYLGEFGIKGIDTNKYMCKHGRNLCIDVHGNFYPCVALAEHSLKDSPFKYSICAGELINTKHIEKINAAYFEGCADCPIALGCESCAMADYRICGAAGIKSMNRCFYHKAKVLGNHYYYSRMSEVTDFHRRRVKYPNEWGESLMGKEQFEKLLQETHSLSMSCNDLIKDHKQYLLDMEQRNHATDT
jgi:uncharacterized protein